MRNIDITDKKIVKATYGNINIINVTNKIISNINKNIYVNNQFIGSDPDFGSVKKLIIYFDDKSKFIINENEHIFLNNNNNKIKKIEYGFIILRYVVDQTTNNFWITCYNSIRKFYDNKIIIIDDHSNKKFLTDIKLTNTTIVNSEFPRRGELLPYYYYYHNKFFDRAIFFHDGITVKKFFDYSNISEYYGYDTLFSFNNDCYVNYNVEYLCQFINNKEDIINYHIKNVNTLTGNFGVMSVIDHEFLKGLQEKYNFLNLINVIKNRNLRIILERFMHTLCKKYLLDNNKNLKKSLFGHYQLLENNTNPYLHKKLYGR